ncbi:MAG TPA: hypothetical protein VFP80_14345 [Thermoanaerobaculia bacterium]|nr:hypothetical protein [Thermoanaerobaculia bacterium]
MGLLVMSFRGVNMHVTKDSGVLPEDVQHRVVSINAAQGYASPGGEWGDVPPHHCFLEGAPDVLDALLAGGLSYDHTGRHISMHGWHMRVVNPAGRRADIRIEGVPCLRAYLHDMTLKPGTGNELELPDWAACFTDINAGTLTRRRFRTGAVYTTWTVETEGDPVLQFTRTCPGEPVKTLPPICIRSTPPLSALAYGVPGDLVLHNGTHDDSDKKFDFVLYFLANEGGVPPPSKLDEMFPIDEFPGARIDMTTSCSNSQYP